VIWRRVREEFPDGIAHETVIGLVHGDAHRETAEGRGSGPVLIVSTPLVGCKAR
jgi:hypothetical protein